MAVLLQHLKLLNQGKFSPPKDYSFSNGTLSPADEKEKVAYDQIIDCSNYLASKGWVDLRCGVGEPGQEYRETVASLCAALQSGGFAKAVVLPNTDPVIQSKTEVAFLKAKAAAYLQELVILGAVTKNAQGEDLTEMLDMHFEAGLQFFGDGTHPLANADRYLKILQYLQKFEGTLFDQAYDPLLAIFGQMHEGEISTQLGMKGIPNLAEEVAIQRNIELLRYAGGRVHFQTLSAAKGVDLIRQAKKEGLNVTADVSIYQLIFTDGDLLSFDTNLKVQPPFRGATDRAALLEGLRDGTLDALVSNHQPQDYDSKFCEFDHAAFGMAGLTAFLPAMVQLVKELGWELLLEKVTSGPEKVVGQSADSWTIFDPTEKWTYNEKTNPSLSANHPWFGQELTGKVKYCIQKGHLIQVND
jgi:dihydroorotase